MLHRWQAILFFCLFAFSLSWMPLPGQETVSSPAPSSPTFVYMADGLSSQVSGFAVGTNGTLTPVPGSPYALPLEIPLTVGPTSVAYLRPYLVVAGSNPNTSTSMTVLKVDPTTGALTNVSTGTLSNFVNYELIVGDPRNHVIYAMGKNNNSASQQTGLSSFLLQSDGNLEPIGPTIYPGSPSEGALALDPRGHFLYDYDITTGGGVYVYPIQSDGTLGTAVTGSPFNVGRAMTFGSPSDPNACVYAGVDTTIVAHPNGKFLYVSCTAGHQVTQLAVSTTGRITVIGSIPLAAKNDVLSSLTMDGAGKYLFGTEENQNQVLVFLRAFDNRTTHAGKHNQGRHTPQQRRGRPQRYVSLRDERFFQHLQK